MAPDDTTTPQCNRGDAAGVSVVTRAFNNVRRDRIGANNESKAWPNPDEEIDERRITVKAARLQLPSFRR